MSTSNDRMKPYIAVVSVGIIFIASVFWLFVNLNQARLTELKCTRFQDNNIDCLFVSRSIISRQTRSLQLTSSSLDIKESRRRGRTTFRYGIILDTNMGLIPLTNIYSKRSDLKQKKVNMINSFITDRNQPSLEIREDDRWLGIVSATLWGLVAIMIVVFNRQIVTFLIRFQK